MPWNSSCGRKAGPPSPLEGGVKLPDVSIGASKTETSLWSTSIVDERCKGVGISKGGCMKLPLMPLARLSNYDQPSGANCSAIPTLRIGHHQKLHRLIECTGTGSVRETNTWISYKHTQARCLKLCKPSLSVISAAFIAFCKGSSVS